MRTEQYRYVEWRDRDSQDIEARELYDHSKDSGENVNIAGEADEGVIDTLSGMIAKRWGQNILDISDIPDIPESR